MPFQYKFNALFSVCVLIFIVGCGATTSDPAPITNEAAPSPLPAETASLETKSDINLGLDVPVTQTWTIAFITKARNERLIANNQWFTSIYTSADQTAAEIGINVEYIYFDCDERADENSNECVEAQIQAINSLTEREVDGLVLIPLQSDRLVPVVDKIIAAGIPVITFDTPLNSKQLLTSVAFNNYQAAKVMGEWVVDEIGGEGDILILEGDRTNANANERKDGFLAGLSTGDINILDLKSGNWSDIEGEQITAGWLAEYDKIDAIVAANDGMALGSISALEEANRQDEILLTGFDATETAMNQIILGNLQATIDQTPGLQAKTALILMIRHLETGETFPQIVTLPEIRLVHQDNVRE